MREREEGAERPTTREPGGASGASAAGWANGEREVERSETSSGKRRPSGAASEPTREPRGRLQGGRRMSERRRREQLAKRAASGRPDRRERLDVASGEREVDRSETSHERAATGGSCEHSDPRATRAVSRPTREAGGLRPPEYYSTWYLNTARAVSPTYMYGWGQHTP